MTLMPILSQGATVAVACDDGRGRPLVSRRHSRLALVAHIALLLMTTNPVTVGIGERPAKPGTVERRSS